jgi:hypothetical protein
MMTISVYFNSNGDIVKEIYLDILENSSLYVCCPRKNQEHLNLRPFGIKIDPDFIFDPLRNDEAFIIDELIKLDQISFGGQGMAMAKWTFLDCAAMPSAIFGLCVETKKISASKMSTKWSHFPISMMMAIPTLDNKTWFGHNLASISKNLGLNFKAVGLLTKILGIEVLKAYDFMGATQWTNPALHLHLELANLSLESAYTLSHTHPESLVYSSHYDHHSLKKLLKEDRQTSQDYSELLDINDSQQLKELQKNIENGEKIQIIKAKLKNKNQVALKRV